MGQTRDRQFDGLADVGLALCTELDLPLEALWIMRNGYAMCTRDGLDTISEYIGKLSAQQADVLRAKLCIGVHSNVEVTDPCQRPIHVSQAYCSALPVRYAVDKVPSVHWAAFATLILEAAYEATLLAAVLNAKRTGSNIVLLTRLGGGVFGNDASWIDSAMRRAFRLVGDKDLDIRLVSYGTPTAATSAIVKDFR